MKLLLMLVALVLVLAELASSQKDMPYPILCDASSEGCIREPADCRSIYGNARESCRYLATWRRVEDGLEIEIGGQVGAQRGYVALGFFPNRYLEGGIAVSCYKQTSDDPVEIRVGHYPSREEFEFLSSDLLAKADSVPGFDKDEPHLGGMHLNQNPEVLECRMKLLLDPGIDQRIKFLVEPTDPQIRVMGSSGKNVPLKPDRSGLQRPTWWYATPKRPLRATGSKVPRESSAGAKFHGCFMVLAWVFCASVGTLLARYYKLQWPSLLFRKKLVWFQLHRGLMATCCILTVISFIIIFIDLRGYSDLDTFPQLLHPILGIIVTVLTITNPLVALCRCQPTDKDRPWYNWIHWIIGTIAYVLAVLNLFLGLRMQRAGRLDTIDYHIWLLIFFVLFQFIIEIILEIHTLYHWRRNKKRWQQYRLDMQEYQSLHVDAAIQQPKSRPVEPRPAGYCLRTFLLVLHGVVAAAVALILVIVIIAY